MILVNGSVLFYLFPLAILINVVFVLTRMETDSLPILKILMMLMIFSDEDDDLNIDDEGER